jgi:hypothetical protein
MQNATFEGRRKQTGARSKDNQRKWQMPHGFAPERLATLVWRSGMRSSENVADYMLH